MKFSSLGKGKSNFAIGLIIKKLNIEWLERELESSSETVSHSLLSRCPQLHLRLGDWDFVNFEQYEAHTPIKERVSFW